MTRMLCATRLATAHSSAAMTLLMMPPPSLSSTFRLTRCAAGAMPACAPYEVVAVAGDDAGDVRAVPVVVVRAASVVDEVDKRRHALVVDRREPWSSCRGRSGRRARR